MTTIDGEATDRTTGRRARLNRDAVLRRAVELADAESLDAVSMRRLAGELDVVPMALYKHVSGKDDLTTGMLDLVVRGIAHGDDDTGLPASSVDGEPDPWRSALRRRILAARASLLEHPWALAVIESSTTPTPAVLDYIEGTIALFLNGGFSAGLTHQLMHALGSRLWGFTHELFPTPPPASADEAAAAAAQLADRYPCILRIADAAHHGRDTILGPGCDDQYEFEFTLDLLLDGFEARRAAERRDATPRDVQPKA
ncbi:TetR family transcriptional regulator [Leifsonia sp. LS1]|uniref:TetR/AcrR family transcriptional regulator n=1 Tax=Leifsonia sp. LS1 TaxID=2828483 RepID=UPI001CFCA99B|nr:TetR/AcrR family transcriptional regulator C-terminal domain-containing protein [Leifsonia sp. LS1]GIT79006.1 TetR family transcriptional regulator [Leifsonia sp. LS1]